MDSPQKTPLLNKEVITHLFARFSAIYGHKWTADKNDEVKRNVALHEWCDSLDGTSSPLIGKAISKCKDTYEWPPSIAEFLNICNEEEGILPAEKALEISHNVHRHNEYHPVLAITYKKFGSEIMRNAVHKEFLPRWKKAYAESIAEWRTNPQHPLLEAPKQEEAAPIIIEEPESQETARARHEALGNAYKQMGIKPPKEFYEREFK